MWTDDGADPIHCPGSGEPGEPAQALADGWPEGRAACPRCQRFVALDADGRLVEHDTSDPDEPDDEIAHRRAWFNANGW